MKMKKDRPRRPWLGRSRRGDLQNNEFDLTIRPVMVRALIVAHEPRQARIAGQLNVRRTRFARAKSISLNNVDNLTSKNNRPIL